MESALTSKGQATIPKAVRDHLRLKAGDRVRFFIDADGGVVILPKRPVRDLRGTVKAPATPVTTDDMTRAAGPAAGDR